jgi:Helix-turn-helix domain
MAVIKSDQPHVREKNNPVSKRCIFLTPKEAAELLRLSKVTLSRWRTEGVGPPYNKFGHCVRYDLFTLLGWADDQTRQNTSQSANDSRTKQRDAAWFKEYGWR